MDREELFDFIDKSVDLVVELETELTRRPAISPDSGGEGEWEKCRFLEGWLQSRGITRLERYDAPDERAREGVRPNLIATIPGRSDERRLWIMSHLDVVPPGEASLWKSDPWQVIRRDDGPQGPVLIGRGVEDNQQGLCSSVLAALALLSRGMTPAHTVKLLFAADEENGSRYGIDWLLKHQGKTIPAIFREDDLVLIPDGGDRRGETIEIAEKNLLWARFTTTGVQAHGSRPDQGINAHLAAADLAVRLHDGLSKRFSGRDPLFEPDYSTFQPTKKEANVPNINTIPGEDVFYMDMRVLPRYSIQEVREEIDRIKAGVEARYGVTIGYTLPQAIQSKPTAADSPLVGLLSRAVREVYAVETRPVGIGGGTVGAYLRNAGIDAVVWSRMDESAHQPNEYTVLANILGDAKVMALLMASG
ncbi:MAG: M20 family metallo-hydrolase [Spirochaetaceae bacterium]|jgi:succinyl-diaminopimelate desuccinylase|nr:M20 family metallo-hydrolase [Spirochaetaceae bacterium]